MAEEAAAAAAGIGAYHNRARGLLYHGADGKCRGTAPGRVHRHEDVIGVGLVVVMKRVAVDLNRWAVEEGGNVLCVEGLVVGVGAHAHTLAQTVSTHR